MAEIFSIIDLYFPSVIKLELRPVPCPFGRQGFRLGYRCRPWATSSPGPSASPTNYLVQAELSRAVIGTICSVKHCLWLVYSVVLLPRHTEKSNLHANEMVVTSAYTYNAYLCGCSARGNVSPALWMDKHARKMLSGERTAGNIGRMCGETTAGDEMFWAVGKEKQKAALKRSPGIVLCVNNRSCETA